MAPANSPPDICATSDLLNRENGQTASVTDSRAWFLTPGIPEMTERELLATVLSNAEMALKRKNTILEAIDALDAVGVFNGTHKTSEETKTSVQKHLNWLLDSLDEANESYKLAREYVEGITEMPVESILVPNTPPEGDSASVDLPSPVRDPLADAHAVRLLLHATAASGQSVAETRFHSDVTPEMVELLRSVGQLLLVSSAHGGATDDDDEDSGDEVATRLAGRAMQTAVAASVQPLCDLFRSDPDVPDIGNFETHLYQNALHSRQQALDSLMEAVNLLNIELTAAHRHASTDA